MIFKLKNIQYNESRIYTFEMFKTEQLGVYVEVQGKKVASMSYEFYKNL